MVPGRIHQTAGWILRQVGLVYPTGLALAWVLSTIAANHAWLAAGTRVLFGIVLVAGTVSVVVARLVGDRDRAAAIVALVVVGTLVIRDPLTLAPFAVGFGLLAIDSRLATRVDREFGGRG
jgi:xanthine/uracil permease